MKNIILCFENNFRLTDSNQDCRHLDFRLYGLHTRETIDSKGDTIKVEYFKDYDPQTTAFDNIVIEERRTYTRDVNTGLPISKVTDIDWFDENGDVQAQKQSITKYYSAEKGFKLNKRARKALIDKASMYLYGAMINMYGPTDGAEHVDDFQDLSDAAVSKYIKSNMQPLLDIITNSTDNTKPEYRAYMTEGVRDGLLVILNVSYKS